MAYTFGQYLHRVCLALTDPPKYTRDDLALDLLYSEDMEGSIVDVIMGCWAAGEELRKAVDLVNIRLGDY